ncbi:serine hydrolase domain-containing protein [Rhodohalobacter halophilus]|uniref:serine hydrolase domain-containing protein n=1 Tax=Rhodohalobacter halophilus TaxID=1812810 RepID=UPI00083F5200|nr:serine hydrolase [Rhodohalobacter halophilus]
MNTLIRRLSFIALLLPIFVTPVQSQSVYYPPAGDAWEERAPSDVGLNSEAIDRAVEIATNHENSVERDLRIAILKGFSSEPYHYLAGPVRERGGPAGMIIKNGYIVAKWGDLNRVDMTFSVTKSYLSTVAGLAWDSGLIQNLDDRVKEYVWEERVFDGEHNSAITWEHLLNQSSDWYGTLFGMEDWGDRPPRDGDIDTWRMRELHEPGTHYKYNDVRVNLLAYSLLHVLREPLPKVLKREVMDPIGASTTWRWFGYDNSFVMIDGLEMQSVSGGGHNGGGLFINTYDQARFGLLFARNGTWNDRRIISPEWIEMAKSPSEPNPDYGYMWWTLKGDTDWGNVPDHLYYAAGFGGNFIIVDQEKDLVIVTRWLDNSVLGELVETVYTALN